ncbi:hypothetical protein GGR56DRAFT_437886 [Xylariaceae sp. FL0804]|nr:hypothetical protein GGR56DRAFT_437886 [Xylariaceae sp. FL0804]
MGRLGSSTLFHKKSKSSLFSRQGIDDDDQAFHARKFSSSSTLSQASASSSGSMTSASSSASSSSSSSSSSAAAAAAADGLRFNPLSLHPPLSLNASPSCGGSGSGGGSVVVLDEVVDELLQAQYREDEERESRFFDRPAHASPRAADHYQDLAEYSPVKGRNCYFEGPLVDVTADGDETVLRASYVYDQDCQWPLKDWQAIPPSPGLVSDDGSSSASSSPASSPLSSPARMPRNTAWMRTPDAFLKRGEWKRRGLVFHLDSEHQDLQEEHFELGYD